MKTNNTQDETMEERINRMFLSWCNDFITVESFAEYWEVTEPQARSIIQIGKIWHNEKCQQEKEATL